MEMIRVLIADDHLLTREGIRAILEKEGGFEVVGEAADGYQAVDLVNKLSPDILLLDYEMPGMNGIQVTSWIKGDQRPVKILAVSEHEGRHYIKAFFKAGVSGFLSKRDAPKHLIQAIQDLANGQEGWVSERVARKMMDVELTL